MHHLLLIRRDQIDTRTSGFTFVELVIVIAIMAITLAIVTFSFKDRQRKDILERRIRELFGDVQSTRIRAVTRKNAYGMIFSSSGYTLRRYDTAADYDTDSNKHADPLTHGTQEASTTFTDGLLSSGTAVAFSDSAKKALVFEATGMTTTDRMVIIINPLTASPAVNCIVISPAHENLGRWNATTSKCEIN